MQFERLAVIGVGLIGGSFALALRQAKACGHVVGAGRNRANLELARSRGIIDSIAADAVAAAHGADLVLVAAPVAQFARISRMDPQEHDALLAAVSHLPHLLAFALVHEIAGRANSAELFSYAAGGFRDFTRIASSHPEMWRDICVANRDRLLLEVERFSEKLKAMQALLEAADGARLEKLFAEARAAREKWIHSS